MNILVTGCFGFISSNTIPKLLKLGHNVLGFDNLSKPSINPTDRMKKESGDDWERFSFHKVDINSMDQMTSAIAAYGKKIDAIIHMAAIGSVPFSFVCPQKSLMTNIIGFTNVLQLTNMLKMNRFVFASSSSVYGNWQHNPRTEGYEGAPLSPYSMAKQDNETLVRMLASDDLKYVGLRFFNVYGPGQSLNGNYTAVIPRFILEDEPEVYGDGETTRDFTFVDDVAEAIILGLNNDGGIYNVGTGNGISLNVLLSYLGKINSAKYLPNRVGDVKNSWAETKTANERLGFKAKVNINEGLIKTKEFYYEYMQSLNGNA